MKKWFTTDINYRNVMRICSLQLAIALMVVGVSAANDARSQLLDTRLTLNLKGASIDEVLKEIETQSKINFVYSEDQLDLSEKITIRVENQSLEAVLDELLSTRGIKYKVHEKEASITLRKHNDKPDPKGRDQIPRAVTGKVTAGTGETMTGVNVLIKGTTVGTTTDTEGKFVIEAEDRDVLVFSFIGFVSFETQVGDRTVIDVVLQEDSKGLNEIVVNAGYWTVKEKEQTGNISRVTAEEIKTQPVSNPIQALSGRMPGVYISQETGVAGGGIQVQIRGKNSITNGNEPLYIIDGIPVAPNTLKSNQFGSTLTSGNPFSTINPNDIESIEVLKDGAATAVYGSRGANGVVLITTKRGASGKTKFDVNVSTGFSQISNKMKVLNTPQYLSVRREAFKNEGATPNEYTGFDLVLWDTTRYTDWQKELIGNTGTVTNLNASVSGGEKRTQFLASAGYYSESTVFPGDFGFKRATGSLNLTHKSANEKLSLLFQLNYQSEMNRLISGDLTSAALTETLPNSPEPYINGKLNWGPLYTFNNPYALLLRKYDVDTKNFRNNAVVSYSIVPGLKAKVNLGYNAIWTDGYASTPSESMNPMYGVPPGYANFSNGSSESWIVEPQIEYVRPLRSGILSTLVGATFQQMKRKLTTTSGSGYTNDQLLRNLQAAPFISVVENQETDYRYQAFFARVNYALKEKYFFELVGRRDGSSRFGPEKKYANFGAISSAWVFSNEDFARGLGLLSFGKVRVSYGSSGNDQIGDYGYMDTYSTSVLPYQGITPIYPTRLANPDYSWESNQKFETAIELGFFQNLLSLSVSYYDNKSTNQLVGQPLSGVTGFASVQANLAATVQNTGLELEIASTNISKQDFTWTSSFNMTVPRNKLVEFKDLQNSSYASRYVIGQPITIEKVYQSNGVDPETGLYTFKDVDGNGLISSPGDNQTIINTSPTLYGGLNNSLKLKNWTFTFFFQFVQQKGLRYIGNFGMPGLPVNQQEEVLSRWTSPGQNTPIQKFSYTVGDAYTAWDLATRSDLSYEDASFIRLKNISLSYQLPETLIKKAGMSRAMVSLQGQNLLTFTDFKGIDPETRSYYTLPSLRVVTVAIQATF